MFTGRSDDMVPDHNNPCKAGGFQEIMSLAQREVFVGQDAT